MRISDWSSDVCSSDLLPIFVVDLVQRPRASGSAIPCAGGQPQLADRLRTLRAKPSAVGDCLLAAAAQRGRLGGLFPRDDKRARHVCRAWRTNEAEPFLAVGIRTQLGTRNKVQAASERIGQSRAQLGIASSLLLPSVGVSAGYSRETISEHGKFAALGAPTSASDFWQLGFEASWELDLWGRARRSREGAAAAFEATVYEREAARVALSAEVARAYLQLRGTQAQLDITRQNLDVADRTLRLAESRERNGVATRFETASARAQLATVEALVPELVQRRNTLMNALALLLGEQPRALDAQLLEAMPLPSLPSNVPVGLPSELAHRRPDIQRAEAQLHAATAAIGVAKADFYPRIGLKGRVGVEAFEFNDLDSWDSRFFSVGPTVYLPIFQGGLLKQRLALNEARQRTAANPRSADRRVGNKGG